MRITVVGTPAPQGSKRHVGNGVMVESSKKVKPWRQDVKYAALEVLEEGAPSLTGPIRITVTFFLARPKGHYGTGRNSGRLRETAPKVPAGKPDIDKLLRSTFDALGEAVVFNDDAQITDVAVRKRFADGRPPGAVIDVQVAGVDIPVQLPATHTSEILSTDAEATL